MSPYPPAHAQPVQGADERLRRSLQDALARSDGDGLDDLQRRVMAQWKVSVAAASPVVNGPVAALRLNGWSRPLRWGVAALALAAALGWQLGRVHSDRSLRDLLEPDVLSMMVPGGL